MKPEEKSLRTLLTDEAQKERRAYKRATLLIAITAFVGLFWLIFSGSKVARLERQSSNLSGQIENQQKELSQLQIDIVQRRLELDETAQSLGAVRENLKVAEEALKKIEKGVEQPKSQAQTALEKISKDPKPRDDQPITAPFLMAIEDRFSISGRGTVVTGTVQRGKIKVGDSVEVVGLLPTRSYVVTGVEKFKKVLDEAIAGDHVGLLLRGLTGVERGQVVASPGSIKPHTKFKARIFMLTTKESGRTTSLPATYSPQFYFRTTDIPGKIRLLRASEIMPGDKDIEAEIELSRSVALEKSLRFAIREGGKTFAAGTVTSIIN